MSIYLGNNNEVVCECDECGAEVLGSTPDALQAKMQARGWGEYQGGSHRCPECRNQSHDTQE